MAFSYPEIKNFAGLYRQANSYLVPDGALEEATNIVIVRDGIIDKRRGSYQWATIASGNANNLIKFQNTLVVVRDNGASYFTESGTSPNEIGTETALTGATIAISGTRVARFAQIIKNLYFTTDNGVLKIETFSGTIFKAGIPAALDLRAVTQEVVGGLIPVDDAVLYRVVFGRTDTNDNLLLSAPSDILIVVNPSTATNPASVRLEFSVPSEIDTASVGYFYQVYRSSFSGSETVVPPLDFKFIYQQDLSASEISAGVAFFDDSFGTATDDIRGAELYTNPNSREGELQANDRPPLVDDLTVFKQHLFYFRATTRHILDFQVIDADSITAGDILSIRLGTGSARDYVAREGVANQTVTSTSVSGSGTLTITRNAHGLVNADTIQVTRVNSGATLAVGQYPISAVTANTFDITPGGGVTATEIDFYGLTDSAGDYIFFLDLVSGFSTKIANTALGIVKAINRDQSADVYARYLSTPAEFPGQIRFEAKGFGDEIQVQISAGGEGFSPSFPSTFGSVTSDNDDQPHVAFVSKIGEPEAAPATNFLAIGRKNQEILRGIALRDSVIVLKEDGVFRITGDSVDTFTVTTLDDTVVCLSASSASVINNQIIALTNQGYVLITDNSVQIISRKIEDLVSPILGLSNLEAISGSQTYETERLYLVSTSEPGQSTKTTTYAYNYLNDTWVTWDLLFNRAAIGPLDTMFFVSTDNRILKERKKGTAIDYCGQNYNATVDSVASDGLSGTITSTSIAPEAGWILVGDEAITRIVDVTDLGSNQYSCTFRRQTNLEATDTPILYAGYVSTIKSCPFHGGIVGRSKQFSEMQIHTRTRSISRAVIRFETNLLDTSEEAEWLSFGSSGGWGFDYWGYFGWGQTEGINLIRETAASIPIRLYVPKLAQRASFIQTAIEHREAGERLEIQALMYAVRAYGRQVSR